MLDTMMEQINKTVEQAAKERALLYGPCYASGLEGYGDVHRQMVGVNAAMKELKRHVDDFVRYVNNQDPQEAIKALDSMEVKAKALSYEALRMCETVVRYKVTLKTHSGGDLLDILNGIEEPEEPEDEKGE